MDECKRMGLKVLAPDVNESYNDFMVNTHGDIRFGMAAIKGVGEGAVEKIIEEREKNGPYKDVFDFFERIDYKSVNKKTLENLITAGGLDSFGYHRAQYLQPVDATMTILDTLVNFGQKNQKDSMNLQVSLFGGMEGYEVTRPNIPHCEPWTDLEKSKKEKELIGIYLTSHPLDQFKLEIKALCTPLDELNSNMPAFRDKDITIAGIIINKREGKTKKGNDFGILTIEDFSGSFELPLFGEDYIKYRNYFILETAIYIKGRVQAKRWSSDPDDLSFNILSIDLLNVIGENLVKSVTLLVDIEQLNLETLNEINNQFIRQHQAEKETNNIPLNFILFDKSGYNVKMFSRTCQIERSRELYEYFENNDAIKMKIN